MAITAKLDTVTTLEAHEVKGRVESMTREALVSGLTATDWSVLTDALDNVGLAAGSSLSGYPNLILVGRHPVYAGGKSGNQSVRVRLEYEYEDTTPRFSGGTTIEQVSTQFDAAGNQITVAHTFPANDEKHPGQTITQGGSVPTTVQRRTLNARIVLRTRRPGAISDSWSNHLNSTRWNDGAARTWKCTKCDWEEFDTSVSPAKWVFDFQFDYKSEGWDETVAFIDPETNTHPPNLVEGTGYKTPAILPERDFNDFPRG